MRKPTLNEIVSIPMPFTDDRKEGEVVYLLAMQFVIYDSNGDRWFCFYNQNWKSLVA